MQGTFTSQEHIWLAATISTLIPQGIRLLAGYVVDLVISQIEILVQGQHPSESLCHFVMVVGCSARRREVHTERVRRQGQLRDIVLCPPVFIFNQKNLDKFSGVQSP